MSDDTAALQALVARVVVSYVTQNAVATADLPVLIQTTAQALAGLGKTPPPTTLANTAPKPAVPIRRSVTPTTITCLICGQPGRMLKRHLAVEHGMTPGDYRKAFGLPSEYPTVAPQYAAQRSALARATGLGTKGGRRKG